MGDFPAVDIVPEDSVVGNYLIDLQLHFDYFLILVALECGLPQVDIHSHQQCI